MSPKAARSLAYYSSADGFGVLAPRGWYCFGTYGSGGQELSVSPVDNISFATGGGGLKGSAVEIFYSYGAGSGGFEVAAIIALVFPAFRESGLNAQDGGMVPLGPYPKDTLKYLSKKLVEPICG